MEVQHAGDDMGAAEHDGSMDASEDVGETAPGNMDAANAAAAAPGVIRIAPSTNHRGHPICQVPGCGKDLSSSRGYHQRYKICEEHFRVRSIELNGKTMRFCQQCGKFQPLEDFNEDRRSCSVQLALHAGRRRKRHALARARKLSDALKHRLYGSDGSGSDDDGVGEASGSAAHHVVGLSEQEVRVLRGIIRNQAGASGSVPGAAAHMQLRSRDGGPGLPPLPHSTPHVSQHHPPFEPPSKSHLLPPFTGTSNFSGMGLPPGYQPAHRASSMPLGAPATLLAASPSAAAAAIAAAAGDVVPNSSDSVQTMAGQVVSRLHALAAAGTAAAHADLSSYNSLLPPSVSSAPGSQQASGWGSAPMGEDRPTAPPVTFRTSQPGGGPGRMVIASTGQLMAHLTQASTEAAPALPMQQNSTGLSAMLASGAPLQSTFPGQPFMLPHTAMASGGVVQPPRSALFSLVASGRGDMDPPSMGSMRPQTLPASAPTLVSPRPSPMPIQTTPASDMHLRTMAAGDHAGLTPPGLMQAGSAPHMMVQPNQVLYMHPGFGMSTHPMQAAPPQRPVMAPATQPAPQLFHMPGQPRSEPNQQPSVALILTQEQWQQLMAQQQAPQQPAHSTTAGPMTH